MPIFRGTQRRILSTGDPRDAGRILRVLPHRRQVRCQTHIQSTNNYEGDHCVDCEFVRVPYGGRIFRSVTGTIFLFCFLAMACRPILASLIRLFRINRLLEFEIVQNVLVGSLLLSLNFFLRERSVANSVSVTLPYLTRSGTDTLHSLSTTFSVNGGPFPTLPPGSRLPARRPTPAGPADHPRRPGAAGGGPLRRRRPAFRQRRGLDRTINLKGIGRWPQGSTGRGP